MDIVGHVSHQILARWGHIRLEAKRKALQSTVSKRAQQPDQWQLAEEQERFMTNARESQR